MKRNIAVMLMILVLLIAGCAGQQQETKIPKADTTDIASSYPLKGVSLSPRSFEGEDFTDFFTEAKEAGDVVLWAGDWKEGRWADWKVEDFPEQYQVGELHFTHDWNTVYFHSARGGGSGGNDIWKMEKKDGYWQTPENIKAVNSEVDEGMPYLSPDENELWFNRWYEGTPAVFRSKKVNGEWQTPELIISRFAGEPTLDHEGNLYFVHHYYKDNKMVEADIYVAYRK
ncbi:MAG: hypothetical protein KJ574_00360 [Nanoarchaeota archaeon]|nr:hypothetical protein [Nanoarchaeota archaeon]